MSVRTRNEFLDASSSDEDESFPSDHEGASDSRTAGLVARSSKRQKLTNAALNSDDEDGGEASGQSPPEKARSSQAQEPRSLRDGQEQEILPERVVQPTPLINKHNRATRRSTTVPKAGVVYLSRIPPFMRPSTVKTFLSVHGPISKIFLTPETPTAYLRRRKGGGNKKHSFIDGWVEFTRRKYAKQCVDAINGQIVGGKKGGWYRDDVWNAKYLKGFEWSDLMQSVRVEEREREERVRVGTRREGKERGEFLRNIERSKVEETRREKRRKREESAKEVVDQKDAAGPPDEAVSTRQDSGKGSDKAKPKRFERRFRQNEVYRNERRQTDQPEEVRRVLSKIF